MFQIPVGFQRCTCDFAVDLRFVGLLCDLLWSDPDKDITGWSENDRGVSFTFGPDVVSRFLQKHDMDLICRAHQVWIFLDGSAAGKKKRTIKFVSWSLEPRTLFLRTLTKSLFLFILGRGRWL